MVVCTLVEAVADSDVIRFVGARTRTVSPEVRRSPRPRHSASPTAYEALLADRHIDAVVLATLHSLHSPQTVAAAQAGKHVPRETLRLTKADAVAAVAATQKAGSRSGSATTAASIPR